MTAWTVVMTPDAEASLALAWLGADNRQTITEAEAAIHDLLGSDPIFYGTPVAEGLFKIAHGPLVAFYSVDRAQRKVEVSQFWRPS